MTTRTIRSLGYGFSDTPATIIAKINGVTVFEGEITTAPLSDVPTGNPFDQWANAVVPLYTFTSTVGTATSLPTSIEVTNGTLLLAHFDANYSFTTVETVDEITNETITTYVSSGSDIYKLLPGETRETVTINGVEQNYHSTEVTIEEGTWWWKVPNGSTITFNALIDAGVE